MTAILDTPATVAAPIVTTRRLLLCGAVGYPLWAVVALAQAATRTGYDLTRLPLSVLSTGALGWLQITNFVVAGVLTLLGAVGLRRVMPEVRWLTRLVAIAGVGLIAAGALVMDPVPGFSAPADAVVTTMSWHSMGHMVAGTITFAALAVACAVVGRRFSRAGRRGLAVASHLAGLAVVAGNAWAISGGTAGTLTLAVGVIAGELWIAGVCAARARRV